MRTWIRQIAFENYPLIVIGLMFDSIRWLIASNLEPGDDPEEVSAIKHDLSDFELVQGGHDLG
jgi:hypothetical protein